MRYTPCHGIRTRDRTLINLDNPNNKAAISSPAPIRHKVGTNSKVAISRAATNNKVATNKILTSRVVTSSLVAINNPAGTSSPMDSPAINNHTERPLWAQQVLMALAR